MATRNTSRRQRSQALTFVKNQLLERAAEAWKRKQDIEAEQLRSLSESIKLFKPA
jgi:hypothetical protein